MCIQSRSKKEFLDFRNQWSSVLQLKMRRRVVDKCKTIHTLFATSFINCACVLKKQYYIVLLGHAAFLLLDNASSCQSSSCTMVPCSLEATTLDQSSWIKYMESVLPILMEHNVLSVGEVLRLRRCNRAIHTCIYDHPFYWKSIASNTLAWKKSKPNEKIMDALKGRCRECAAKTRTMLVTSKWNKVRVCMQCTTSGYNQLLSRMQILPKKTWTKFLNKTLVPAKYRGGMFKKYYYWAHDFHRTCK